MEIESGRATADACIFVPGFEFTDVVSTEDIFMGTYTLPELPYDCGDPHISGAIMELHCSKHHPTCVKAANTTLEQNERAPAGKPR